MKKILVIAIALAGVAAVGAGVYEGGFWLMSQHFNPEPPAKHYPKPANALQAQRQDLDYFARLIAMDRSFKPAARAEANRRIARLAQAKTALPRQMLTVQLMQIAALSDNGHTHLRLFDAKRSQLFLPVRIARFQEGFYVMRAKAPYRDLLGGKLESIDGMPFGEIVKRLETLRGGIEAFRRENAALFIAEQDLDYGLGIAKDPRKATWTVQLPSGKSVSRTLQAARLPKDDDLPYGDRWLSPEPHAGMGPGWVSAVPAHGGVPLTHRDMDRLFESVAIPGSCARYIRLQLTTDDGKQLLEPFLDKTEAQLKAHPPCAAIVDLRGNGGGDYTKASHFAHALPQLVRGRIVLLTDPNTFSAAITTTAFIKETGGKRVTILGEPVGDRLAFFAEGNHGQLPNLGLSETYETGKHDYGAPCTDWHVCYWLNWFYPVRVKTLQPDERIPQRFADWNAGRDPAFDRAVELVNGAKSESVSRRS